MPSSQPGLSARLGLVNSGSFENFILLIVILNTCTLSAEHYGQTETFTERLWWIDGVFNLIYTSELLMKWSGIGIVEYFRVPFNCLDFSIVCGSLAQYGMSGLEGVGAARMLRVLYPPQCTTHHCSPRVFVFPIACVLFCGCGFQPAIVALPRRRISRLNAASVVLPRCSGCSGLPGWSECSGSMTPCWC